MLGLKALVPSFNKSLVPKEIKIKTYERKKVGFSLGGLSFLPLTALTLGLFYPLINILVLKITDFILGSHFDIHGTIMVFVVSIIISIMNAIMDNIIIDGLLKGKSYEK